ELVAHAPIESDREGSGTRIVDNRSREEPVVPDYVCIDFVGEWFGNGQKFSVAGKSHFGWAGGHGAERTGGVGQWRESAIRFQREPADVVSPSDTAARIQDINQASVYCHAYGKMSSRVVAVHERQAIR